MLIIEHFFGKYMRGAMICPSCGMPVWNGNFVVILQARKYCPHCRKPFVEEPEEVLETVQQPADEKDDDTEE